MKIPKKLKVGAYTYTVVKRRKCDVKGKDVWGYCDRENHAIMMQTGMDTKREKEVLLHECLHAIEESYGISLGEGKVNLLALALLALIDDNKLRF